jgi:hypothetical protein
MSDENESRQDEQQSIPDPQPEMPGYVTPTEREQSSVDPSKIERK